MSRKEFTVHDVIVICSDIAKRENIMVQIPPKSRSLFKRLSKDFRRHSFRGDRTTGASLETIQDPPDSQTSDEKTVESKAVKNEEKSPPKYIPGLQGRDVVGISILVNEEGPIRTYREDQAIPEEEYNSAKHVITTHVPCYNDNAMNGPSLCGTQLNVKTLADVLTNDIDADKANKLKKRMSNTLMKLHTTDVSTARAFLKVDRFVNVRTAIKNELLHFVTNDLKMACISDSS